MFTRSQQLIALGVVLAAWILLALVSVQVCSPPAPRGAEAPATEFSAARALVILKELVGDGIPHPTGSDQNAIVRERILRYFRDFGYQPEIQTGTVPHPRDPLTLRNILVRRPGTQPGRAIMLASHYDSVQAGPGASDDGVGVAAVLEIARMMSQLPSSRNDIIFLVTDAEEPREGLLGARTFVREHPWARDVGVAINLEARGTSGRSLMFETSADDAWLIQLFARHVTQPSTSSLYYEVYKWLRNDTDFTVFKKHGMEGYNFAFVRHVRNYHTENDNYENADPGSLQHHGDNAWQLLRTLADLDVAQQPRGRAIYTDILGQWTIWWPESANLAFAVGILTATVVAFGLAWMRGLCQASSRRLLAVPILLPLAIVACWPLAMLAPFSKMVAVSWPDQPLPFMLFIWCLAVFVILGGFSYTPLGRLDVWSGWQAAWLYWNVLGLLTAWFVPGASYLFTLPGGVAAATSLIAALLPRAFNPSALLIGCCLAAISAGILWLPMQILLYDGLGFALWPVYSLSAALLATTAMPLVCERS